MTLSCNCDFYYDVEPGDWEFGSIDDIDFEPLSTTKRKRCASCNILIQIGSECLKISRTRHPYTAVEARIHGVDFDCFEEPVIKMSSLYQCEKCGEIWMNLHSIGFECLSPGEDMIQALKDYQHDYAPPKL